MAVGCGMMRVSDEQPAPERTFSLQSLEDLGVDRFPGVVPCVRS